MRPPLVRLAARQGGAFTTAQALAAGYSRDAIRHRVDSGRWSRLGRGVLAVRCEDDLDRPWQPLVRECWAALLAHRDAVVGYGTAARLHGLDTYRPIEGLELVRPAGRGRTPARGTVTVQSAELPAGQVSEPHGVPSTSRARTAADIARRGSLRDGVVALDSALRLGTSLDALAATLATADGWPGARSLRRALVVADPGAESPLESLAHVLQFEQGIPRPRSQVDLFDADGFIGRVDDYWPGYATVGESDGLAKYDRPGALREEKLRQERLERTGLQVVRVTYADVTRQGDATARRYREAFDRGRRRLTWGPLTVSVGASPGWRGLNERGGTSGRAEWAPEAG